MQGESERGCGGEEREDEEAAAAAEEERGLHLESIQEDVCYELSNASRGASLWVGEICSTKTRTIPLAIYP